MATGNTGAYRGVEDTPEPKEEVEDNYSYDDRDCKDSPVHGQTSKDTPTAVPIMRETEKDRSEWPIDETAAGVAIPASALNEKIIKMFFSGAIPDITQSIILGKTYFLLYKGRRSQKEAMTYDEAVEHLWHIVGSREWVGQPVILWAMPLTLQEGRGHMEEAGDFIRSLMHTKIKQEHLATQEVAKKRLE